MAGEMNSQKVSIREHRIPSAGSKPYIAVEGPDGALWFCESGASKIGRFDPDRGSFTEFALPTEERDADRHRAGADGNLWFARKSRQQDRPHHAARRDRRNLRCRRRTPAPTA